MAFTLTYLPSLEVASSKSPKPVSSDPLLVRITSSGIRASALDTGSILSYFFLCYLSRFMFCPCFVICVLVCVLFRSCLGLVAFWFFVLVLLFVFLFASCCVLVYVFVSLLVKWWAKIVVVADLGKRTFTGPTFSSSTSSNFSVPIMINTLLVISFSYKGMEFSDLILST